MLSTAARRTFEACQGGVFPYTREGVRAFSKALRLGLKCRGSVPVTKLTRPVVQLEMACAGPLQARSSMGKPCGWNIKMILWMVSFDIF